MGKFFVRCTVVFVSIYMLIAFLLANFCGVDILTQTYVLLFEVCVVIYCFCEGKYHCKYIRYTALSILLSDTITRLDYLFDFLSVEEHNLIPAFILAFGMLTSITLALRHFYLVMKLKNELRKQNLSHTKGSVRPS